MLVDKRKNHARSIHLTRNDYNHLMAELGKLPKSDLTVGMSIASAVDKDRICLFTENGKLCVVEAKPGKPNFWHGLNSGLVSRLTDARVEVLVSPQAKELIGDNYLNKILDIIAQPMTMEHTMY
jgi:hypothetical protein